MISSEETVRAAGSDQKRNSRKIDHFFDRFEGFFLNLTSSGWFGQFMLGGILVASVQLAFQADPNYTPTSANDVIDTFITVLFTAEIALKFLSLLRTPWKYFIPSLRPLKVAGWNIFDFVIVGLMYMNINGAAILRLFRLLRVLKIVNTIPQLKLILAGLVKSLGSIFYIFALLMLMFYVFGIVGMLLFQSKDPHHFGNLGITFVTLFHMATGGSWTQIMYPVIFSCAGGEKYPDCLSVDAFGWIGFIYFTVFVLMSGMVLLNLVIGVITNSMETARKLQNDEVCDCQPDSYLLSLWKNFLINLKLLEPKKDARPEDVKFDKLLKTFETQEAAYVSLKETFINMQRKRVMYRAEKKEEIFKQKILNFDPDVEFTSFWKLSAKQKIFRICQSVDSFLNGKIFQTINLMFVCLASLLVGLQTEDSLAHDPNIDVLDYLCTAAFTAEAFLKFVSKCWRPWMYFVISEDPVIVFDYWNTLDLVVVIASYINVQAVAIIRVLRLLRIMKLIRAIPTLRLLLNGLVKSLSAMFYVLMLLLLLLYIYAIMGMVLFSDTDVVHFGSLGLAFIALFQMCTSDDWPNILYTNMYGCTSVEDVSKFCNPQKSNSNNLGPAIAFCVTFMILSATITLNLVIGVITSSMEQIQEEIRAEKEALEFELKHSSMSTSDMLESKFNGVSEFESILLECTAKWQTMSAWLEGADRAPFRANMGESRSTTRRGGLAEELDGYNPRAIKKGRRGSVVEMSNEPIERAYYEINPPVENLPVAGETTNENKVSEETEVNVKKDDPPNEIPDKSSNEISDEKFNTEKNLPAAPRHVPVEDPRIDPARLWIGEETGGRQEGGDREEERGETWETGEVSRSSSEVSDRNFWIDEVLSPIASIFTPTKSDETPNMNNIFRQENKMETRASVMPVKRGRITLSLSKLLPRKPPAPLPHSLPPSLNIHSDGEMAGRSFSSGYFPLNQTAAPTDYIGLSVRQKIFSNFDAATKDVNSPNKSVVVPPDQFDALQSSTTLPSDFAFC